MLFSLSFLTSSDIRCGTAFGYVYHAYCILNFKYVCVFRVNIVQFVECIHYLRICFPMPRDIAVIFSIFKFVVSFCLPSQEDIIVTFFQFQTARSSYVFDALLKISPAKSDKVASTNIEKRPTTRLPTLAQLVK